MKYKIVYIFILTLLFIGGCDPAENSSIPRLDIGQDGIIECGGNSCALAATEETWREYRKSLRAKDTYATAVLIMSGKLLIVDKGTKTRVIDYNPSTALSRIRILEGKEEGLSGWIPFEHIIKTGRE